MWTYGVNNNRQILICNPKANDTQTCLTWNSYPYVANNSTWHTSIFDMKQLSMKQQEMKIMFGMKQLSICGKQQQMTHKHFWHETVIHMWQTTANDIQSCLTWKVIHVLFIYLFKIYFTFLISQAVKLTIYTGRKTKIFTYNMRK